MYINFALNSVNKLRGSHVQLSPFHSKDEVCMASTMAWNCGLWFGSFFQQASRSGRKNDGRLAGTGGRLPSNIAVPASASPGMSEMESCGHISHRRTFHRRTHHTSC